MKTVWRILAAIMLLVIGALLFIYFSPDFDMFIVRSESMVPTINMGDLVVTGRFGGPLTKSIDRGTIVTYEQNKNLVTHRIVDFASIEAVITQGDNTEDPDPNPIPLSNIVGIYLFKVPRAGYLVTFVQTRTGWFLTIIIPTVILVGFLVKDIVKEALKSDSSEDADVGN
jgi:signal peptidase